MSGKTAILSVKILGDASNAVSAMGETGDAAGGLVGKIGSLGPGLLAVGTMVAGAAIAAGKYLYDLGSRFDEVTDTIRVGTGATGQALDSLVGSVKNIATTVPADFNTIGTTVADVNTRLGLTGPTLEKVSSQYLEAGRILGEEINISETTAAMSAFKIEGEATSGALDTLFRVSQGTGVSMNDLASSVRSGAPALQELGFSFETSAALVGTLDRAGLDADKTISSLGKGLVTLAKDGEAPQAAFTRVIGDIEGLIAQGDRAQALNLSGTLFGTKGAPQFLQAIENGTLNINALTAAAHGTGDTILGVGQETQDAAEKWQILKNKAEVALEPLASKIFTGVGAALDWLLGLTENADVTAFLNDAGPILQEASDRFMELGEAVMNVVVPIVETLAPYVAEAVSIIKTYVFDFVDHLTNVFTLIGALMNGDWAGAWDAASKVVESGSTLITNLLSGLWSLGSSILSGMMSAIGSLWSQGWDAVVGYMRTVPDKITSGLATLGSMLYQAGSDAIQGLINGIGSMGSAIWDAATNIASNVVGGIKSFLGINSPSRVGHQLGAWFGVGLAQGIDGQTSMVTRAGKNLVSPLARLDIPTPSLAPKGYSNTAATGDTWIININASLDPVTAAKEVDKVMTRRARLTGATRISVGGVK